MADSVTIGPLTPDDAVEASELSDRVWRAYGAAQGRPDPPAPTEEEVDRSRRHFRRHAELDPDDAHAAWDGDRLVGVALARRRETLWGLSLLIVDPDAQSRGVGRRLLDASLTTVGDAATALIVSSQDPRAAARYAFAGFALHPTLRAAGALDREALGAVDGERDGDEADHGWIDDLGRDLRGAGYGPDLAELAEDAELVVVDRGSRRGWAFIREAGVGQLGATDVELAADTLRAALARTTPSLSDQERGEGAVVPRLGAAHQWAIDVVVHAGLRLAPWGPVCVRGRLPAAHYLPHGMMF